MKKINVLCYKVKKPAVYNKGTEHEKRYSTFLKYELPFMTDAQAQEYCNQMNATKTNDIEYYFIQKQEEMY